MAPTRKLVPREKIAEAKHLYEQTLVPSTDIASLLGLSRSTFTSRVREWGWKKRKTGAQPSMRMHRSARGELAIVPATRPRKGAGEVPRSPEARIALAERIQTVAEREIAAVEQVLTILGTSDASETEAAARTLASLARTLRELRQLDATMATPEPTDDEPVPRDIEELRRSLARKLDALVAGRQTEVSGES